MGEKSEGKEERKKRRGRIKKKGNELDGSFFFSGFGLILFALFEGKTTTSHHNNKEDEELRKKRKKKERDETRKKRKK